MDKNIHNDGLEDFLRKSFEQYDDSPSDGLWDEIEADLATGPVVRPINAARRWWMTAAVAATLVGLIICQHFFYKAELNSLNQRVEEHAVEMKKLEERLESEVKPTVKKETAVEKLEETDLANELQIRSDKSIIEQPSAPIFEKELAIEKNDIEPQKDLNKNEFPKKNVNDVVQLEKTTVNPSVIANEPTAPAVEPKKEILTVPNFIDHIHLDALTSGTPAPKMDLPLEMINQIKPLHASPKLTVGLHQTVMKTWATTSVERPLPPPGVPPPPNAASFENTIQGYTSIIGLTAALDLNKKWYVQSGLNYQKTVLSSSKRRRLKFGDFQHHNVPGNPVFHEYEYDYYTPLGMVEIGIRADQNDPGVEIDEEEKIEIDIKPEVELEYVGIPFLAGKKLGKGRLHFDVRAGLVANFLIDNNIDFSDVKIKHKDLVFNHTSSKSGRQRNAKTLTWDYLAAVGIEYRLLPALSLHAMPIITGSVNSNHSFIQSTDFSAGLDVGLNYCF